jgi:hypothetical protein
MNESVLISEYHATVENYLIMESSSERTHYLITYNETVHYNPNSVASTRIVCDHFCNYN